MRILYDCFSCSPYYGSDEGIGWNWPYYMRKYHEVWALVRGDRRFDIEKYCKENNIHDIHFIYADLPDWLNFYYRNKKKNKNGALDFLAYQYLWQFVAYHVAKQYHKDLTFDIVHKVGTNDFRIIGHMYRLNIPYIIGPIGGAQETNPPLLYYTRYHKKQEKLRSFLNRLLTNTWGYRNAIEKADCILCSNLETQKYLVNKITNKTKCEVLTEIGCTNTSFSELNKDITRGNSLTFLWAGRMEYRKGLELLFDALEYLLDDSNWKLILCGDGSERERYQKMIQNKKYYKKVVFIGKVAYENMQEIYREADVFVFPSLRETTGTVIVEAMEMGLPVVALKQGGAVLLISENEGDLIDGESREEIIINFAKTMQSYIDDRDKAIIKGRNARDKVIMNYSWEKKVDNMLIKYEEILSRRELVCISNNAKT